VAGTSQTNGAVDKVSFDFREAANGTATMLLDINAALDTVANSEPWQNSLNKFDVNKVDGVTPLDALNIINELNTNGPHSLAPPNGDPAFFYDVNGDNAITPLDALLIINHLNDPTGHPAQAGGSAMSLVVQSVAVPEPTSALLLALGGLAGLLFGRRRRMA
jgi:hypothetical protein